jgi:uncharacterized protein involved in propanediol utilization
MLRQRSLAPLGPSVMPIRRTGIGQAPAHHGEILQGVFDDAHGQLRRGLVTMPMPGHGSHVSFSPRDDVGITVEPAGMTKSARAAELALRHVFPGEDRPPGGVLKVHHDVMPAVGMGSSTSDVVATIRAVADCAGTRLPEATVARLAVEAETASDSIMIEDQVVLFAQRDGVTIETLGVCLPPLVVVGCDTEGSGIGVETLAHPAAVYDDDEISAFRVLRTALRRAVVCDDLVLLGQVATASARINQRYLKAGHFDDLIEICRCTGGVGVQVAHSGTIAGVMFDGTDADVTKRVDRCECLLAECGVVPGITFTAWTHCEYLWSTQ